MAAMLRFADERDAACCGRWRISGAIFALPGQVSIDFGAENRIQSFCVNWLPPPEHIHSLHAAGHPPVRFRDFCSDVQWTLCTCTEYVVMLLRSRLAAQTFHFALIFAIG